MSEESVVFQLPDGLPPRTNGAAIPGSTMRNAKMIFAAAIEWNVGYIGPSTDGESALHLHEICSPVSEAENNAQAEYDAEQIHGGAGATKFRPFHAWRCAGGRCATRDEKPPKS